MTPDQITKANAELRVKPALDIVRWAVAQARGNAIVSTNFRPYEAVLLHLVTQVQPDIPVLWVDHGYNRPATYRHAESLKAQLKLNIKAYLPKLTAAHYDAFHGGMPEPTPENEERIKAFSAVMKLEPFQRGMQELAPAVWLTALRKVQNPNRAGLDIVSEDTNFGSLRSALSSTGPTPTWKRISSSTISRTSGIILIPPRRTKNASAASTRRGEERRCKVETRISGTITNRGSWECVDEFVLILEIRVQLSPLKPEF